MAERPAAPITKYDTLLPLGGWDLINKVNGKFSVDLLLLIHKTNEAIVIILKFLNQQRQELANSNKLLNG